MTTEQRRIRVKIDPLGKPTVEAVGFLGIGCTDATAPIERALAGGDGTVDRVMKPEWSQTAEEQDEQNRLTW